jgi:hypothetical protein
VHFLIGFLIVCVILAVPGLRKAAFALIGLAALLLFILYLSSNKPSEPPTAAPSPGALATAAAERAAAQASERATAREAIEKSNHLISADQVQIREVMLTSGGSTFSTYEG